MEAVFLDLATVDRGDLDRSALLRAADRWRFHDHTDAADTLSRIGQAEVVVANKTVLDRAVIASAPHLRFIAIAATGTNNVDLEAARAHGVAVANVTGYATASVVQHVFGLILALSTRLADYRQAVLRGDWQRAPAFCLLDYPIHELAGRTLGIIGYGELGRGVARVAEAFGMAVLIAQRPGGAAAPGRVPLTELVGRANVITLHVPLAENTRGLIGAAQLALMRPDAILINTARGGIVDEQALAEALRAGRLGGAGVDVLSVEPPRTGNPLLAGDIPNLIVTPHVAWASLESRQRLLNEVAANIHAYRSGMARNRVP